MTKVIIVTKYASHNYGAMLQAWALQHTLQNRGVDCKILNYRPNKPRLFPKIRSMRGLVNTVYTILFYKKIKTGFERFEHFICDDMDLTEEYYNYSELCKKSSADIYIAGSDQVWNPYAMDKSKFLDFVGDDSIKMSYAASMGVADIPETNRDTFRMLIENMHYISVREENAKELIQKYTNIEKVCVNVDPVMLIDVGEWNKLRLEYNIDGSYFLCYFLYNEDWINDFLKQLHKETKKKIVLVTADPYRMIYNNITVRDAGPKEFLSLIAGADCVITSSFHGVALSIANKKPFYALVNPNMPSRITQIINIFGLSDRIITKGAKLDFSPIDYDRVEKIRQEERDKSIDYLMSVINRPIKNNPKRKEHNISTVGIKCTGCTLCEKICPVGAIEMKKNDEGFSYPCVDDGKCVKCGLCTEKCHVCNGERDSNIKLTFYGRHKDERIRLESSSGGVFSAVADRILKNDGVVFGAYFDSKEKVVKHTSTDQVPLSVLRKSKYVESDLGDVYCDVKDNLGKGRKVMFCGTPCQCAGLRRFVGNDPNLIICDFFCHGVPSPSVFKDYLTLLEKEKRDSITDYRFRTKQFGWSQYGTQIVYEKKGVYDTVSRCEWFYVSSMLDNLFLRKSCYSCKKNIFHESDITVGDFWGVFKYNSQLNDNKGISIIMVNTDNGRKILDEIRDNFEFSEIPQSSAEYAIKEKKNATGLMLRNKRFQEYKTLGVAEFVKKYYRLRIMKNRVTFELKKKKYRLKEND